MNQEIFSIDRKIQIIVFLNITRGGSRISRWGRQQRWGGADVRKNAYENERIGFHWGQGRRALPLDPPMSEREFIGEQR